MTHYDLKYNNVEDPITLSIADKEYVIERCEDTLVVAEKQHEAAVVKLFQDLKIPYGELGTYLIKMTSSTQAVEKYVAFAEKVLKGYLGNDEMKEIRALKLDKPIEVRRVFYEMIIADLDTQKNKYDDMGKLM